HASVEQDGRVFTDGGTLVVDGPCAETKELIAGYWIWNVRSLDEAVAWVKRCPIPVNITHSEIEIRQIFEQDEFGEALSPELRAQEDRLPAELAGRREK